MQSKEVNKEWLGKYATVDVIKDEALVIGMFPSIKQAKEFSETLDIDGFLHKRVTFNKRVKVKCSLLLSQALADYMKTSGARVTIIRKDEDEKWKGK